MFTLVFPKLADKDKDTNASATLTCHGLNTSLSTPASGSTRDYKYERTTEMTNTKPITMITSLNYSTSKDTNSTFLHFTKEIPRDDVNIVTENGYSAGTGM